MSTALASKRFRAATQQVDRTQRYTISAGVALLKQLPTVKFDETVELALGLSVDPKRTDQVVRGTVLLPHGTGKTARIAVFCQGEQVTQALAAGADVAGGSELIAKVNSGWAEFDVAVATPRMMPELAKVGKILGPRGLMPSPKAGTVTDDLTKAIMEVKRGKVEFKQDKQGNLHLVIGKRSFSEQALTENAQALCEAVRHARPAALKGSLVRTATLSATMSPGIPLDATALFAEEAE